MNHMDFIEKNVKSELIKQGFSEATAQSGAWQAVDHYKRCSQATKKGAMFDDCLYRARVWCETNAERSEKPKKKTRARKTVGSLALF
ncbi:hypothetical protein [Ewingella americana]